MQGPGARYPCGHAYSGMVVGVVPRAPDMVHAHGAGRSPISGSEFGVPADVLLRLSADCRSFKNSTRGVTYCAFASLAKNGPSMCNFNVGLQSYFLRVASARNRHLQAACKWVQIFYIL